MLNIKNYGSSSEDDGDDAESSQQHSNEKLLTHFKPIDPSLSIAKSMQVVAAPVVMPTNEDDSRVLISKNQEILHNPKYDELFAPTLGPENPFKTEQMKAERNILSGYVEKAHISEFQFENQRRTFTSYGYALDPSNDETKATDTVIVSAMVAPPEEADGKTVFETIKKRPLDKKKRHRNDQPEDITGFLGPWGGYEGEQR